MAAIGSNSPALTSPAFAITREGPDVESRRASAWRSIEPRSSAGSTSRSTRSRPSPNMASAFVALGCTARWTRSASRQGGEPVRPSRSTSTPCCSAHHERADGQGREVGRGGAGRHDSAPGSREVEEVEQPPHRRDLELSAERGRHRRERVLVDGRCQPVGGEGSRRDATRHEVEEPRAGRGVGAVEPTDELLQRRRAADPAPPGGNRRSCGPWRPPWPRAPAGR